MKPIRHRLVLTAAAGSFLVVACVDDPAGRGPSTPTEPDQTAIQATVEALNTLVGEERAKTPATGTYGPFHVTQDPALYRISTFYPCERGYNTEFEDGPRLPSELAFELDGHPADQSVCADGTVRSAKLGEAFRYYFVQERPYVFADAPDERIELLSIDGYSSLLVSPAFVGGLRIGLFRLYIIQRSTTPGEPGVLVEVLGTERDAVESTARRILKP